jgi:large subunit ribosomal protein L3
MKYILGTKVGMTQFYKENGTVVPVTVIQAGPVMITQVKTTETDGYNAVQVGYGEQKKERIGKARLGQMKDMGPFRHLQEFRFKNESLVGNVGDSLDIDQFSVGDKVQMTSTSKSKGFQGVVKRHGFHGGPRSHGQKHSEREPGSIGGGLRNRVPKGMRMAGRTGGDTITLKNVKVVAVDTENNTILVKGAVPGRKGTLLALKA